MNGIDADSQPTEPHSGHPGFLITVPPPEGFE
jgi:hypothetical protein